MKADMATRPDTYLTLAEGKNKMYRQILTYKGNKAVKM